MRTFLLVLLLAISFNVHAVTYVKSEDYVCPTNSMEIYAMEGSIVSAYSGCRVYAYGGSTVHAFGDSVVHAYGGSVVHAYGGSLVHVYLGGEVKAKGGAIMYHYKR